MSRFIRAAPGYVGFEEGGNISEALFIVPSMNTNPDQITEAVRRKLYGKLYGMPVSNYLILIFLTQPWFLLDELEKPLKVTRLFTFQ